MRTPDIFDKHAPRRQGPTKKEKQRLAETGDHQAARRRKASFKNYLREIEEEELGSDLDDLDDDAQV
jgi:hypothetical protein